MNLHIFQDGLGHYMYEAFERIERLQPDQNYYINFAENVKGKRDKIYYTQFDKTETLKYIYSLPKLERVFIHYHTYTTAFILKSLKTYNPQIKAVWLFWSADFYNLPKFLSSIYLDYSKNFFLQNQSSLQNLKTKLFPLKAIVKREPFFSHRSFIKSAGLFDYFAAIIKNDYKRVVSYTKSPMQYIPFAYLSYEQMIDDRFKLSTVSGDKIMINHSADPTLNHFEILETLKEKKVDNILFLPLAYGNKEYKNQLLDIVNRWFENAEIQSDFVDKIEYNMSLLDVGYAIFNSRIQQGLGNITVLLWYGAKIFLREENTIYQDFKEWGLHVYSVQKDLPDEQFKKRLSPEEISHNREILKLKLSSEKLNEYFQNLLSL